METYEEPIDDFVLGGSQRSGFIASLIAKKEAGKDFDPLANKQGRKKRGLTRFDKNKIDLVSDNIIDNVLKSKPLEKWRDKQVETYKKKKVFSPNLPYPGKQPSKEGMSKTDMLKMLTIKEIRDLVSTLRGKLNKDGKPKDKAELLKTLSNYSMDKLMTGIGAVVPPEKIEKLQGKLYPMWKNPKKPEKKEPEPEPEPEPKAKAKPNYEEMDIGKILEDKTPGARTDYHLLESMLKDYDKEFKKRPTKEKVSYYERISQRPFRPNDKELMRIHPENILTKKFIDYAFGKYPKEMEHFRKGFEKWAKKRFADYSPETAYKGFGMPPEKLFYESAKQSYEKVAPNNLNGFQKIADTPTLDAYMRPSDKTILIASRGTNLTSFNDLKADASLVANNLVNTNRYAEDKNALMKVMEQYPPEQYEYYLSGHSLAGAIITQLKRDFPFLKTAVAYNSAFQTKDLTQQPANVRRYYTDKDFLYNLGGKYFRNNIVIPADKEQAQGFFQRIKSALTPSGITGHSLSNFEKVYKGQGILKLTGSGLSKEEIRDIKIFLMEFVWREIRRHRGVIEAGTRAPGVVVQEIIRNIEGYIRANAIAGENVSFTENQLGTGFRVERPEDIPDVLSLVREYVPKIISEYNLSAGTTEGLGAPLNSLRDYILANNQFVGNGKPISIARDMSKRPRPFSAKEIQQVKKAREDYYKTLPPAMTLEEAQLKPLMDNPLGRFAFEVAKVGQNIVKPVIREAINLIPETKGLKELKQVAKNVIDILPEDRRLDDGRLSGLRDRAVSGVQNFSPVQKQARNLGLLGDGKAEPEDQIDFDKIQWGTFEAGMKRYKKQHPYSKVKTLEDFAKIIRKNPNKFSKAMVKKANFYLNVLKKD
jgi:hypothetical protein